MRSNVAPPRSVSDDRGAVASALELLRTTGGVECGGTPRDNLSHPAQGADDTPVFGVTMGNYGHWFFIPASALGNGARHCPTTCIHAVVGGY